MSRKDRLIEIRVTADEKRTMAAAAEMDSLPLATWLRRLALREASATLGEPSPLPE